MKSLMFPSLKTVVIVGVLSITMIGVSGNWLKADSSGAESQVIQGNSGGPIDSKNCGFVAESPNYTLNLQQRIDYMKMTVQAAGGQPTLLVVGPSSNDSFCVLGDRSVGLQPEISGVWEPGTYNIYVGDRTGSQHQFTLNISQSKN